MRWCDTGAPNPNLSPNPNFRIQILAWPFQLWDVVMLAMKPADESHVDDARRWPWKPALESVARCKATISIANPNP